MEEESSEEIEEVRLSLVEVVVRVEPIVVLEDGEDEVEEEEKAEVAGKKVNKALRSVMVTPSSKAS